MAEAGYTPIQIYYSSTPDAVPSSSNLIDGELALNIYDKKLFFKDSGGAVFGFSSYSNPSVASLPSSSSIYLSNSADMTEQSNTQSAGVLSVNGYAGANGQRIIFRLKSTNVQVFSWSSIFQGSTDISLPTQSSGSNLTDYMGFIYNSSVSKWQLLSKVFGF